MAAAIQENRDRLRAYVSERRYAVYKSGEHKSDIRAAISFLPMEGKSFSILKSSGGMAEKVVRKALEKEVELTRQPEISELTPANYHFSLLGAEVINGRHAYVLVLEPKRKSKDLLRGRAWVDTTTFQVQRVEGEPAKNPSWWIKELKLVLTFRNVDGMWLQTGSEADAHVRFAGRYQMLAQDERITTATALAKAAPRRTSQRRKHRATPMVAISVNRINP
jgi:hypothetical protein